MPYTRLPFPGVLLLLVCLGCAHSLVERNASSVPLAGASRAERVDTPDSAGNGAATPAAQLDSLLEQSATTPVPNRWQPLESSPVSPPLFTATPSRPEFLLADLDRALNSPGSDLPIHYQEYLRAQLAAIAARAPSVPNPVPVSSRAAATPGERSPSAPGDSDRSGETVAPTPAPPASRDGPVDAVVHVDDHPPTEDLALRAAPRANRPHAAGSGAARESLSDTAASEIAAERRDVAQQSPGAWRDHLNRTLQALEQELSQIQPGDREGEQLAASARLLHLIANHREQAVAAIEQMAEDEREFWKHQIHALLVAIDADNKHAGTRRAALALREIRDAADHLANLSALDVRHLAFCESVTSFGVYAPVKSASLKPGQEVLLYVEIDNFVSEQVDDRYETRLQAEYHILAANGERISKQLPPVEEKGRNRRRDFFISYQMEIPEDLRPGEYTLQLIIEDRIGRKSSQASLDFRVR